MGQVAATVAGGFSASASLHPVQSSWECAEPAFEHGPDAGPASFSRVPRYCFHCGHLVLFCFVRLVDSVFCDSSCSCVADGGVASAGAAFFLFLRGGTALLDRADKRELGRETRGERLIIHNLRFCRLTRLPIV